MAVSHVWETYFFSSDENNLVIIVCHVGSNIFFASVIEKFVRAILLKLDLLLCSKGII